MFHAETQPVEMAQGVHGVYDQNIPEAVPVIQWDVIQERLFWHLDMAVRVVLIADNFAQNEEQRARRAERAATNEDIKISLIQSFNWLTGVKISTRAREAEADDLRETAQEHRENAQQIRSAGIKVGVGYLLLATGLEVTRWLYQQGLLHSAWRTIKNAAIGVKNAVVGCFRSICMGKTKNNRAEQKLKSRTGRSQQSGTVVRPGDIDNDGRPIEPKKRIDEEVTLADRGYTPGHIASRASAPAFEKLAESNSSLLEPSILDAVARQSPLVLPDIPIDYIDEFGNPTDQDGNLIHLEGTDSRNSLRY